MNLLKRYRSARTGQYVRKAEAQASPDTTVNETTSTSNITFVNHNGEPLEHWAIRAGMTIDGTEYTHSSYTLIVQVKA